MRAAAKGNLEEFARRERYKFLYATAVEKQAFAVFTGHTKNDQAETFDQSYPRQRRRRAISDAPDRNFIGREGL